MKSQFLKSTSLIFIVNILNSGLSFLLPIFASRLLGQEFGFWTVVSSVFASLIALIIGINLDFIKNSAKLSEISNTVAYQYYFFLRKTLIKVTGYMLLAIPVVVLITYLASSSSSSWLNLLAVLDFNNLWLTAFLLLNFSLSLLANYGNNFILGVLDIPNYAILNLTVAFLKLVLTVVLIYSGFGVFALLIGLLVSQIINYAIPEFMILENIKKLGLNLEELKDSSKWPKLAEFSLKDISQSFIKTGAIAFVLNILLTGVIIFANRLVNNKQDLDLLAVLSFFGNIIFFGVNSALGALVSHGAKSKDFGVYIQSLIISIVLGLGAGFLMVAFGRQLLDLLGKSQYINSLPLIWIYSGFVVGYNVLYTSIQFFLSKSMRFLASLVFPAVLVLFAVLLAVHSGFLTFSLNQAWFNFGFSSVGNLTNTNLVFDLVAANLFVIWFFALFSIVLVLSNRKVLFTDLVELERQTGN